VFAWPLCAACRLNISVKGTRRTRALLQVGFLSGFVGFVNLLNDFNYDVTYRKYLLYGPYVRPNDKIELPSYFSIINPGTPYSSQGYVFNDTTDFFYDRNNIRFEHAMVYRVIDTNQRYIQSLGLGYPVNQRAIHVDPHGQNGADDSGYTENVSYSPGLGYISFGTGGVDDAEDTDLILHEYGHAIQNNQAPGVYNKACTTEAAAMGEGFGDYWQASNLRLISHLNGFDPACYAEWDWRGDVLNTGTLCKRRVDSPKL
jgi:Fungalysin metallopeptidase (M36)